MTQPPPENLMDWPKANLCREVERLRAIMLEHALTRQDPATSGGDLADPSGDPHAHGSVVIDTRGAILMDALDVSTIDAKDDRPVFIALLLQGRVNREKRRARQLYMFDVDGAAAIVSQIVGLVSRAGAELAQPFHTALDRRMKDLPG